MGINKNLANLVIAGAVILGFSGIGAGIVESERTATINKKIDKANREMYNYGSLEREQKIAKITEEYTLHSQNYVRWGAGIGALTGLLVYALGKWDLGRPLPVDENSDDGSTWVRTEREYSRGYG